MNFKHSLFAFVNYVHFSYVACFEEKRYSCIFAHNVFLLPSLSETCAKTVFLCLEVVFVIATSAVDERLAC